MVVNFPSASLRSQPRSASRFSFARSASARARLGGHPQLGADLLDHDRRLRPPQHIHDPLVVRGQHRLAHAALAPRHQQHRTARDLPGSRGRRRFPLRFGVQLLGQPTCDPLGDGEFLQLVAHLLELLAQRLYLHLEFGPAGRDQLTKVGFRMMASHPDDVRPRRGPRSGHGDPADPQAGTGPGQRAPFPCGVKHPMQLTRLGKKVVAAAAPYTDQFGDLHGPRHKPKALASPELR
ncbi:hypothetical protein AB0D14_42395 [Streptomyces sp. NPDC048484]|uniref:hypothetical protein n=1 Tax=Streptomyces sp. NPDC048484 TaxID=3155146 RepID=UPI00342B535C